MIRQRTVTVYRAADYLGLPDPPTDPIGHDLWDALRSYAEMVDIYDEETLPTALIEHIEQIRNRISMWSPWVGKRAREFTPVLREAAAQRDVQVRIVVLPDHEVNDKQQSYSAELQAELTPFGAVIVFLDREHHKIILLDDDRVFIGSMNVLSHSRVGGRRETIDPLP